ncbi:tetratricopeptide repeat protein [Thalassotalea aquiviva]|uniref:tetratricopeptide repeat protein n=1 Tax=Thalassotalea aquiviva TaxID=3242415 RepID=UPI00352A22F9
MYKYGLGQSTSLKTAYKYFERAANKGFANSQFALAMLHVEAQEEHKAIEWLQSSAEQGYAPAQFELFYAYKDGLGTDKNIKLATRWLVKAAQSGHGEAASMLAYIYEKGIGIPEDIIKAGVWWKRAAALGDISSKVEAAMLYGSPNSSDVNHEKAINLLKEVENSNTQDSNMALGWLALFYEGGYSGEINYEKAVKYREKAIKIGETSSLFPLGLHYLNGSGVEKDFQKAMQLFKKAGESGDHRGRDYLKVTGFY